LEYENKESADNIGDKKDPLENLNNETDDLNILHCNNFNFGLKNKYVYY